MPNDGNGGYHVSHVRNVLAQVRSLLLRARAKKIFRGTKGTLERMIAGLATDPIAWGDPEYRTRKSGGLVSHRIFEQLSIHYVVFEEEKVVILFDITPVLGHPLA